MTNSVFSAVMFGFEAHKIEVETALTRGQPQFIITGLASKTVDEARERISSALEHCQIQIKAKRTIVNLAPADLKKNGSVLDLAIAVCLLKAYGLCQEDLKESIFFGELALSGKVNPIHGCLPLVLAASELGFKKIFVPIANTQELAALTNLNIFPLDHLATLIKYFQGKAPISKIQTTSSQLTLSSDEQAVDFDDIKGQKLAKRALEIAAAGHHNLLFIGPPGCGKSMLAKAFPSILPHLNQEETLEVSKIYSLLGLCQTGLMRQRPFRSPHHSASLASLIGGGQQLRPGEISLAHCGVLFLDELPEFSKNCLEALREPLEEGQVTITRVSGMTSYPANFSLLAAMNPCPCGFDGSKHHLCTCSLHSKELYQKKISGPLLDRIDLKLHLDDVKISTLNTKQKLESSALILQRVKEARALQKKRYQNYSFHYNAKISSKYINKHIKLTDKSRQLLIIACEKLHLSARSFYKIIKVARTIADLSKESEIQKEHILEALQYR